MTREEIIKILNELYLVYPRLFKDIEDPRRKERYIALYTKYLGDFEYVDVSNAIDKYIKSEGGRYDPSFNDLINYSKAEKKRRLSEEGKSGSRIVTPEEEMYNIYLKEMKKPVDQRNEWLIERCLPSAKLFNDPRAYREHFGKSREEFEKL